ncbi:MAG: hypothetical protein ACPGU5_01005 [Lishizhenia sp.]
MINEIERLSEKKRYILFLDLYTDALEDIHFGDQRFIKRLSTSYFNDVKALCSGKLNLNEDLFNEVYAEEFSNLIDLINPIVIELRRDISLLDKNTRNVVFASYYFLCSLADEKRIFEGELAVVSAIFCLINVLKDTNKLSDEELVVNIYALQNR